MKLKKILIGFLLDWDPAYGLIADLQSSSDTL